MIGQPVQVNAGQVRQQVVELADGLGGERPVKALVELLSVQPSGRVMLAQEGGSTNARADSAQNAAQMPSMTP